MTPSQPGTQAGMLHKDRSSTVSESDDSDDHHDDDFEYNLKFKF